MRNSLGLKFGSLLTTVLVSVSGAAHADHDDQIVVTASPLGRAASETIVATSILDGEELERRTQNSIGETLRSIPGVSSSYFGPGASRPIIRGLGGDRIRVLDAGIGSIDVSASSPDHAVAVEPSTAQRIEIVRGAGTLLYGSSAAGGVVNVFSGKIPDEAPEDGYDGSIRIGGATVDDSFDVSGNFDAVLSETPNGTFVLHGDGFFRDAGDYDIPGFAESERFRLAEEAEEDEHGDEHDDEDEHEDEEDEAFGTLENSSFKNYGGSAGLSWIFENGFFGISGTAIESDYGLPGGHGHGHEEDEHDDDDDHDDHDDDDGHDDEDEHGEEEEEGGVRTDLRQRRLDLHGRIDAPFLVFESAEIRAGLADYEHNEVEDGDIGTIFSNEGWEARLQLVQKPVEIFGGTLRGAVGVQYRDREFSAVGEEAFVPETESEQFGVFMLNEFTSGIWRFELGARYEGTDHTVLDSEVNASFEELAAPLGFNRSYDNVSVSAGIGAKPMEGLFVGVNGFRTERAPSTEELFSNGPHLATNQFEIGDPTLEEGVARGVEGGFRFSTDRYSVAVNGFYTSYDNFIYEIATGDEEDELPVFQFLASDATFRGFEAELGAELFSAAGFDFSVDGSVDYVRATVDVAGNENLPRIPPLSGQFGLEARSSFADFRFEVDAAASQEDTADFELATDGYQVLNTFLTLYPVGKESGPNIRFSVENLTDEEVRLHTSFVKDLAPLPGRNFRVSVQGKF